MRFGELNAEVAGVDPHGSPVVLLHGLTFDCSMWAPLINVLGGRRVLAFDLPGHGNSQSRYSYEPGEVAALLHDALLAAGVQKPVLVGHSIGGLLATAYAGVYPSRAVLNIDQPLLPGVFGEYLRSVESVLRGPDYLSIWATFSRAWAPISWRQSSGICCVHALDRTSFWVTGERYCRSRH